MSLNNGFSQVFPLILKLEPFGCVLFAPEALIVDITELPAHLFNSILNLIEDIIQVLLVLLLMGMGPEVKIQLYLSLTSVSRSSSSPFFMGVS
jgi:hypothetical protein